MNTAISIVDFAQEELDRSDDQMLQCDLDRIAHELVEAFNSAGFVYLKNCGISEKQTKDLYAGTAGQHGWISLEREMVNPEREPDLKESFNVVPYFAKNWPEKDVPGFKMTMMDFYEKCSLLTLRVLKAMAVGLKLEDADTFVRAHHFENGPTTLRSLYYPGLKHSHKSVKPNQIRCGEHTDYGSITLIFQDDVGGLQVQNKAGEYIPAPPIPDTVVINVADLMQRWTSDRLVSTRHRVVFPDDVGKRCEVRQSLAFFVHPDRDYLITSLSDTQKYEPITVDDYLKQRFDATYLY